MLTAESWHGPLAFADDARRFDGGVAEWLNAAVSKTVSGVKPLTRVRIPPPPLRPVRPPRSGGGASRGLASPPVCRAVVGMRPWAATRPGRRLAGGCVA